MKKAVFAGSFDPPTNGHLWMISQGAGLFDELVVAVGTNPSKVGKYMFSLEERVGLLEEITRDYDNVSVAPCESRIMIRYASSIGADYLLRGVRDEKDFVEEKRLRDGNAYLDKKFNYGIETVLLIPPRELSNISSTLVRGLIGIDDWETIVEDLVPKQVYDRLKSLSS